MHSLKNLVVCLLLVAIAICLPSERLIAPVQAQDSTSNKATLTIRLDQPGAVINRNIYGQFAEHLGRLIYEGRWVGEGSRIPNTRGLRNDLVAALKELHVPVLRWPGVCFADEYHWRDGVGPRDKRPRRPNSSWGGVDTNAFGTHEFMDLCEMNTFERPNDVKPASFTGHKLQGSQLRLNIPSKSIVVVELNQTTLKDTFKNDFMMGAALNQRHFSEEDARGAEIVRTHFNSITPENVLKWALVHPEPARYDFAAPDRFVEFGEKHGMFIVGHTLVWHNQTPRWVFEDEKKRPVDRATLLKRLREHIFTVVGRYKGKIKGWDVVNEALNQDGTMRQSPWFKIIGEDYLIKAFEFAHEADPSAELYYNDYDLELPAKRAGAVELIKKLKAAGVQIAGVGLQNHNLMDWPSAADEDATITAFANLGLKVHITELDVDVLPRTTKPGADYAVDIQVTPKLNPYVDGLPDAMQTALAKRYAELFQVYRKHRGVIERVTFWGVADGDSWLNNWPMRGRTNYPLLFDRSGKPKPALAAVIETVGRD